jgi:polyisoprenoid-binding protein YceI
MQWSIDAAHSTVEFRVRHMGIATVRGQFKTFEATAELDDEGALQGLEATIDVKSIDTGVEQRDNHLRSPDFFDVDRFGAITFRSTGVEADGANRYQVTGDLTIREVTRPVALAIEVTDIVIDPWGNRRIAGEASTVINRKDFGLTWNQVLEMGALLVGEDVKVHLEVEAVAPQEAAV